MKWLVLSTSGLLVLLNAGIGILALWSHRAGLQVTERLITSGELDAYHPAWLTRCGYRSTGTSVWYRRLVASEVALRSLSRPDTPERTEPTPPEHPLTLEAWHYIRDARAAAMSVTEKALAVQPALKTARAIHAQRLTGYLPPRRTRRDDHADRALWAAGLIAAGWGTLSTASCWDRASHYALTARSWPGRNLTAEGRGPCRRT
ncbi:hypothetical protein GCM10009837_82030 [Streptomyces durmitorensis]